MVARLLAKLFWDTYDFLGRAIVMNLICFLGGLLIIALPALFTKNLILFLALLIIPLPGLFAGSLYFFSRISDDCEPTLGDFFTGAKRFFAPALLLAIVFSVILAILSVNIYFYLNPRIIPAGLLRLLATLVAGFCFWGIIFVLLMMIHAFPLLVVQNLRLKENLKRSALLVLDNPLFSMLVLALLVVMWGVGIMLYVGPVIFLFSFSAALLVSSFDTIRLKYEKLKARAEKGESAERVAKKPASWKEIKREGLEAKPDRYKRGLRDLFKPWEY
jgi:uncharacterized membrane protein YesL